MSLRLRKLEPADVPYLYQWENDASVWADGANHNPLSHSDLRDYVEQTTGDIYKDGQLRLVIELRNTGSHTEGEAMTIGCADLFDLDVRNRRAAIGLYIAPEYRGKGCSSDVLGQLEEYAFGFLHLRVVYAVIGTGNKACNALFAKAGYEASTPLKDWTLEGDAVLWLKSRDCP